MPGVFPDILILCAPPARWAAGKPAPDVYLKVAEDLKVDPETCLVFEDVPNGILAGKKRRHGSMRCRRRILQTA